MGRINKVRLIDLSEKVIDCIDGLEKTIKTIDKYKNIDPIVVEMCNGNFRSLFNGFQALVEDYTALTLKTVSISVSNKHFKDCLELCVSEEFLSRMFVESFLPAIRLRNKIAHGYKEPSTDVFIEYYKENINVYEEFLNCINTTLSRLEDESNINLN